jgi:single-stranded-DNA-specific exonuclease
VDAPLSQSVFHQPPSGRQTLAVHWLFPPKIDPETARCLAADVGVEPWVAEILLRRGMMEAPAAMSFLKPLLRGLTDPFLLPGMELVIARIIVALDTQERIVLFGDYDVDGVTSLTILARVLRASGGQVTTFLPHRMDEGYGLSADGVARCVEVHAPKLLIAVDCGTTSVAEIAALRERGIDCIVLDHHEPKSELPPVSGMVNPKVKGDAYRYFCSAGIAFKVAHALLKKRPVSGFDLKSVLDLVAVATVADIVPLVEENRILVRAGLERMEQTSWPGLRALIDVSGLKPPFNSGDIGFGIGPRLNASGRLASAEASLELLLTDHAPRATILAKMLDQQNRERREVEDDVATKAEAQLRNRFVPESDAAIVVGGAGWHPGVVGIVASRIQRRHYRPTVVIGFDADGVGKGSGRSIEGFSLISALGECAGLMEKFGGHEMAAGLTIRQDLFEEFRTRFGDAARAMLSPEKLVPRIQLDAEIPLGAVNFRLLEALASMQPFGTDNRQPVFFARRVLCVGEPRVMKERHYSINLRQGRSDARAVWWGAAETPLPPLPWDVAFTVSRNEWNGSVTAQVEIKDLRTSE